MASVRQFILLAVYNPEQEPQEEASEEPENLDPDSDKSEGDIIDEITGQMKLF